MNDLVSRVASNVGIDPALAEKAIGMMLGFLQREAADGPVARMIESIPGATELVAQYNGEGQGGGGLLGGLMSAIGGGGVMGLGQQLMSQGLGMGEITGLAKETIAVAREHAGDETVDEVVASVPGLGQFV
jgi:threonine dehydrogenase-like Zn-dependent dehydrogenase